jgi:hypothetical protein
MASWKMRLLLVLLLVGAVISGAMSLHGPTGRWLTSAGLLFDIAGIVQLEISGLFDEIIREYGDVEKYPYGPPSRITRDIIDDPDAKARTWLRNTFYFERRTGFKLLLVGFAFQYLGDWL